MKKLKLKLTIAILAVAASTQITNAMLYSANNADLLLLFRSDSVTKNVEVDLGSVTNLLNLAAGASTNFSYVYSTNQVKTNFNNSFSTVLFTVIGVTAAGHGNALWVTDSSDSSAPANFGAPTFSSIRNQTLTIGSDAGTGTGNVAGSNYVVATSVTLAYSYVLGGNYSSFGGYFPFSDELLAGGTQNFYQFNNSGAGSAALIGSFSMNATTGVITFTRASTAVPLVASQIVNIVRSASSTQVSFTTTNGNNYQLLYKTDLTQAAWLTNSAAGVVAGNNATNSLSDTTSAAQRFYRIQSF